MDESPQAIGPYLILELLGRGGMGVVYRAAHEQTGQFVALKTVRVTRATLLQTIRREIHALARLRHPGIARILAQGLQDGLPWYAMELVEGRTLLHAARGLAAKTTTSNRFRPAHVQVDSPRVTRVTELPGQAASTADLDSSEAAPGIETADPDGARLVAEARPLAAGGALLPVLTLVRRLCAPLAFLHGEGLVHRDLKPDNVLVRSDGVPVLVDFGLASEFSGKDMSREQLEASSASGGTVAYMAPEQARGDLVDARADLYALGCVLYELLTGRPPFVGASPWQVIFQHFEAQPAPPSERVDGVPAELDELVLRLLAKEPRQRLGHADAVAAALEALGVEDGLARSGPKPRAHLYRPGFAGREQVFGQLKARLDALLTGSGALVLVGGESGVGKTRLALELARLAVQQKVEVLRGECLPGVGSSELRGATELQSDTSLLTTDNTVANSQLITRNSQLMTGSESARAPRSAADRSPSFAVAGVPLEALRKPLQSIADCCREGGAEETERLLGPRGKLLAHYETTLEGLPGQTYPEVVELPAEAARQRLFVYLAETFEALCEHKPHLLLLDDLQWADELTLGFLDFWLETRIEGAMQAQPLLIVGTYRSEEAETKRGASLPRLIAARGIVCVPLDRLDEVAVGSMVSDMLALVPPPAPFVRYLARESEGNPFFVAEHLRTAVAEGLLARDGSGRWQVTQSEEANSAEALYEDLPLPHSIHLLVSRRLDSLSPDSRILAESMAVLGRAVEEDLLNQVAPLEGLELLEATRELLARQVILEAPGQRLSFVHDKIREVAYERMDQAQRSALHGRAAEGIELRFSADLNEHLAALGQHWERAGNTERARECYLEAARNAVKNYAYADAEWLYRATLKLVDGATAESIAARNELGEWVLQVLGKMSEALCEHQRALEEARLTGDLRWEATSLFGVGLVYRRQGRKEEAREMFEQALELHRQAGNRREEGMVLGNLATLHGIQGRPDEARALFEQALVIHRLVGDLGREGATLCNLALLRHNAGRLDEARELYEQALDLVRQVDNRRSESYVLGNLANLYCTQGRLEEAREMYTQALELYRQVGDRRDEGFVLGNLALLQADEGRIEEARDLYGQALSLFRQFSNRRGEGIALYSLADLERRTTGDAERAGALAEQARRLLEGGGYTLELGYLSCCRGHITLADGQSARASLEQARALAAEANAGGDSDLGRLLDRLERAQDAFEAGRPLFRGECVEDFPEALRKRVLEGT